MDRLAHASEMLDGSLADDAALRTNLRDLRLINRLFGAATLSARAIDVLTDGAGEVSLLDVGTGSADIPKALLDRWRRDGRALAVTALDARREVVEAARSIDPSLLATDRLTIEVGDGLALPYPDATFDVAHCSLLVHHFEPDEAAALLAEMRRVSRNGIVVNDLLRGRLQWLGAQALTLTVARGRFTRHDAPLSVRRAYTLPEVRRLLETARLRPVATIVGAFRHRFAVAAR